MCNCSKKTELGSTMLAGQESTNSKAKLFKYIGKTALTVQGLSTKINYRFKYNGDVQLIEATDIQGIMHIPVLRPA